MNEPINYNTLLSIQLVNQTAWVIIIALKADNCVWMPYVGELVDIAENEMIRHTETVDI